MAMRLGFEPPGRIVQAGLSSLHLHVSGCGKPVVVLEAGIAATSLSWALVQPAVARFATVVSYDRAGLGWSGPAVSPRTPSVIAGELHAALRHLGLSGPYILCGHSFGGLVVQQFARLYKEDVCGLVLVDALGAGEWCPVLEPRRKMLQQGVRLSRRGAMLARWGIVGASLRLLLAGNRLLPKLAARVTSGTGGSGFTGRIAGELRKLPRELWPVIAWHWSQPKNFEGMARHLECLPDSASEMIGGALDPGLPVTALVAAGARVDNLPVRWKVTRVPDAGHWIQLDQPSLVISAIRDMISVYAERATRS